MKTRAPKERIDWLAALKRIQDGTVATPPYPHRLLPGEIELPEPTPEDAVLHAAATLAAGEFVIILDDPDREGEGDLVLAAEFATEKKIAFMIMNAHGTPCVALTADRCNELALSALWPFEVPTTEEDRPPMLTPVDAKLTHTGVSAKDRAVTTRWLINPDATIRDFRVPGHVVPLRARVGGVLHRRGHTEASTDLAKIAGIYPAAVLTEIMLLSGEMARGKDLEMFSLTHGIPIVTVDDIVKFREEGA